MEWTAYHNSDQSLVPIQLPELFTVLAPQAAVQQTLNPCMPRDN